jgi:hypothetical protein
MASDRGQQTGHPAEPNILWLGPILTILLRDACVDTKRSALYIRPVTIYIVSKKLFLAQFHVERDSFNLASHAVASYEKITVRAEQ